MNNNKRNERKDIYHNNLSRVEFANEISPLSRSGRKLKKAENKEDKINESEIKYKPIFNDKEKENV